MPQPQKTIRFAVIPEAQAQQILDYLTTKPLPYAEIHQLVGYLKDAQLMDMPVKPPDEKENSIPDKPE